ncbi:MAG: hypothetical protein Q4D04_02030 [Clostridia bacterium]|nr:hypothetical protein [Clostridia bacterium]
MNRYNDYDDINIVCEVLERNARVFEGIYLDKREAKKAASEMIAAIAGRDASKGFEAEISGAIKGYFGILRKNAREERAFLRRSRRRLKRRQKGLRADYDIKPAAVVDVRQKRLEIARLIYDAARRVRESG